MIEVLALGGEGTPPTVRDAVLARAARLSAAARETLEVAAVIGFRSESWLLAELSGVGIEDCISAGMLRVEPNALAFPHELSRNPILELLGARPAGLARLEPELHGQDVFPPGPLD